MEPTCIKILLIDDEAAVGMLLGESLRTATLARAGRNRYEVAHALSLGEGMARLKSESFDLVLLDLTLPDSLGLAACEQIRSVIPSIPIIILTGIDDEKLALQAVREGAEDYLVKGQIDAAIVPRAINYAIERKRAQESLRKREEFFRLISENVSDLIAVVDANGRRIYNGPSYAELLGDPVGLRGTDAFDDIHPEDRERIKRMFAQTLATGIGQRAEYRMITRRGIRHIETQGSVIQDDRGKPSRIVVVGRDITERKEAIQVLRQALTDLNEAHEALKSTQQQLIAAEVLAHRHQAVSTFAAGVAHEVKNPLQTIILGIDYLSGRIPASVDGASMVFDEMAEAVRRADAIIRGLMEFAATSQPEVKETDLNALIEQALRAAESELAQLPIQCIKELAGNLPAVRLEARTMKHVLINLLLYGGRSLQTGGQIRVRTVAASWGDCHTDFKAGSAQFKPGENVVLAEVECLLAAESASSADCQSAVSQADNLSAVGKTPSLQHSTTPGSTPLGVGVLKKIVELYGGAMDICHRKGPKYTLIFPAHDPSRPL